MRCLSVKIPLSAMGLALAIASAACDKGNPPAATHSAPGQASAASPQDSPAAAVFDPAHPEQFLVGTWQLRKIDEDGIDPGMEEKYRDLVNTLTSMKLEFSADRTVKVTGFGPVRTNAEKGAWSPTKEGVDITLSKAKMEFKWVGSGLVTRLNYTVLVVPRDNSVGRSSKSVRCAAAFEKQSATAAPTPPAQVGAFPRAPGHYALADGNMISLTATAFPDLRPPCFLAARSLTPSADAPSATPGALSQQGPILLETYHLSISLTEPAGERKTKLTRASLTVLPTTHPAGDPTLACAALPALPNGFYGVWGGPRFMVGRTRLLADFVEQITKALAEEKIELASALADFALEVAPDNPQVAALAQSAKERTAAPDPAKALKLPDAALTSRPRDAEPASLRKDALDAPDAVADACPIPVLSGNVVVYVGDATGSTIGAAWDWQRRELAATIHYLKPTQSFGLILSLDDRPVSLDDSAAIPANADGRKRLATFLESTTPRGLGDPVPALKRAFDCKPNEICFVSDGFTQTKEVLALIRDRAAAGKVRVHTVALTRGDDRDEGQKLLVDTLRTIARETRGDFKALATERLNETGSPRR